MTVYEVTGTYGEVDFGATGIAEIVQNVRTIITTLIGTVPLDREFGVDMRIIDQPIPAAQAKYSAELYRAIKKYEPRVRVRSVKYTQSASEMMNGKITPVIEIEVIE